MPPTAPRVVVFNANETETDANAEAEELGTPLPEGEQPAPPAEPTPAEGEQPPAEPQQAAPTPPNKTGVVPFDRFQQQNHELQEARKQLQEMNERWARMDERTKQLNEARQAAQQAAEAQARAAERPDPALDPVGAQLWDMAEHNKRLEQQLATIQTQFQQSTQNLTQQQQEQEFSNWVNYEANRYAQTNPHYQDAVTYAANKRIQFWQALGAPPEMARDIVQKESFMVAAMARQTGQSFAPLLVQLATDWGWKPPQANGNGTAQPAAQPGQRVAQLQRGQAMQGLSRVPAGGAEANTNYKNYTPAQIADMTEAEFSRVKADPRAWADLQIAIAKSEGLTEDQMGRL